MNRAVPSQWLDAEPRRDSRPQPAPPKYVAIDDIEGDIVRGLALCRPNEVLCQKPCIGHIGKTTPLSLGPRPAKRPPCVSADRRIDRESGPEIHGVTDSLADDSMRAMDAPGEAVTLGGGIYLVLLSINRNSRWEGAAALHVKASEEAGMSRLMLKSAKWAAPVAKLCSFRGLDKMLFR